MNEKVEICLTDLPDWLLAHSLRLHHACLVDVLQTRLDTIAEMGVRWRQECAAADGRRGAYGAVLACVNELEAVLNG